jgi:hypothetical protein
MDLRALSCSRFCLAHVFHTEETLADICGSGQWYSVEWLEMPLTIIMILLKALLMCSFPHARDKVLEDKRPGYHQLEAHLPAVYSSAGILDQVVHTKGHQYSKNTVHIRYKRQSSHHFTKQYIHHQQQLNCLSYSY